MHPALLPLHSDNLNAHVKLLDLHFRFTGKPVPPFTALLFPIPLYLRLSDVGIRRWPALHIKWWCSDSSDPRKPSEGLAMHKTEYGIRNCPWEKVEGTFVVFEYHFGSKTPRPLQPLLDDVLSGKLNSIHLPTHSRISARKE